jgi:hypothetical protein
MNPKDERGERHPTAISVAGRLAGPMAVTSENLDELMAAPLAVVVVADVCSANGARYLAELSSLLENGELGGVVLGVLERAEAAGSRLAQRLPLLSELRVFPYTIVFAYGQRVDAFAAVRADVLLTRLERVKASAAAESNSGRGHGDETGGDWWSIPLGSRRQAA